MIIQEQDLEMKRLVWAFASRSIGGITYGVLSKSQIDASSMLAR